MIDKEMVKAIVASIREGKRDEFERLVSKDQTRWSAGEQFGSWLHVAAEYGQLEVVKLLTEMGLDINKTNDDEERSPLLLAIYSGNADVVSYLLGKGAQMDVSKPDYNPLFAAIDGDKPVVAKMLIDAGIDTTKRYRGTSGRLKDALSYANDWGRKDIAKMIEAARTHFGLEGSEGMIDPSTAANDMLSIATSEGIAAFRAAVDRFPQEKFYAFCFYTDNDLSSVYPHANTIESLKRVDSSADPNYFQWAPAEWKLDFGQYGDTDFMRQTNELLQRQAASASDFAKHKHEAIRTLSEALLNIKNSSVFGGHGDPDRLAFWVNIGDASEGEIEWMFEPVVDYMPTDIVEQLRTLFEFRVGRSSI